MYLTLSFGQELKPVEAFLKAFKSQVSVMAQGPMTDLTTTAGRVTAEAKTD